MRTTTAPTDAAAKRQFLVYLEPDLIRRTKIHAIQLGTTASEIVHRALIEFLAREGGGGPASEPTDGAPGR